MFHPVIMNDMQDPNCLLCVHWSVTSSNCSHIKCNIKCLLDYNESKKYITKKSKMGETTL